MKRFTPALALLMTALLSACASHPAQNGTVPDRAGPAYVHWLEQQSMLREASRLTSIVSGSALSWRYPSQSSPLPDEACTWLRADAAFTATSDKSFFAALAAHALPARLASLGIHGLYLGGTADTGDEWLGHPPLSGMGEDACGLGFGRIAGTQEEYETLLGALSRENILTGGALLPAHTGMGPDFFLSQRAVRDYPGMYAMTELPQECWTLLPNVPSDAPAVPLGEEAVMNLAARGLLPEALVQDVRANLGLPCGWAVTAPVAGVDGMKRRWAYRWYGSPLRPVLHWDDPSGTARRTMEASLIQQSGMRHQALVGLHAGAWIGLDALPPASSPEDRSLEPGRSAVDALSRNAHRYGSALLLEDAFPPEYLPRLQQGGADLLRDTVTSPALEHSLLSGNAAPLRHALRRLLTSELDQRRLWRSPANGREGLFFAPLQPFIPADWASYVLLGGGVRASAPLLAAMACGLAPGQTPDEDATRAIQDAHMAQLAFPALLPGLFMLSGSDLSGMIPDGEDWSPMPPAWSIGFAHATPHGLPTGRALYRHGHGPDGLAALLALRSRLHVYEGRLVAAPDCGHDAAAAAVTALPDGRTLAVFVNLSGKEAQVRPDGDHWRQASERHDAMTGASVPAEGFKLPAWGWSAVLLS